jgi:hypothetical protein
MRRDIEAAWRGVAEPQTVAELSARSAALVPPVAKSVEVTRWAYRVTARVGAENREFVVFGESLSDAALQAERRLAERIPRARVLEIATLAEAL